MNMTFKPTSIQSINNPANDNTAFLWFNSVEVSVGIVITEKNIKSIIDALNEIKKHINTNKEYYGDIKQVSE